MNGRELWSWLRFLAAALATVTVILLLVVGVWALTELPWPHSDFDKKTPAQVMHEKYSKCMDYEKDWTYNAATGSYKCS